MDWLYGLTRRIDQMDWLDGRPDWLDGQTGWIDWIDNLQFFPHPTPTPPPHPMVRNDGEISNDAC